MNKEFENAKVIYVDYNDTVYEDKLLEFVEYKNPTIVVYDFKDTFRILFFNNSTQFKENFTFDEQVQIYKKATKIDYSKQASEEDDELISYLHHENETLKAELTMALEMLLRRVNN